MALLADRTQAFDSSGIRKVFDLAAKLQDPINLSIGQPDYDVPEVVKSACIDAIRAGKNAYTVTQGLPSLREKLQVRIDKQWGHADRKVFVSLGTSGGRGPRPAPGCGRHCSPRWPPGRRWSARRRST